MHVDPGMCSMHGRRIKKGRGKGEQLERKKGEGACFMVVSYLIHVNKLLIVGQAIRHLRTPAGQGPQK